MLEEAPLECDLQRAGFFVSFVHWDTEQCLAHSMYSRNIW